MMLLTRFRDGTSVPCLTASICRVSVRCTACWRTKLLKDAVCRRKQETTTRFAPFLDLTVNAAGPTLRVVVHVIPRVTDQLLNSCGATYMFHVTSNPDAERPCRFVQLQAALVTVLLLLWLLCCPHLKEVQVPGSAMTTQQLPVVDEHCLADLQYKHVTYELSLLGSPDN